MSEDYIDVLDRFANKFLSKGLLGYKLYLKVLGTDVSVSRIDRSKQSDSLKSADQLRYSKILQAAMNVNPDDRSSVTENFTYRILINKSNLSDRYRKQDVDETIMVMEDVFKPGDIVSFRHKGHLYRYKVSPEIESFGLDEGIVYKITLNGFRESK